MKIALVTGSNQGIGFEIVKQLFQKNIFDLILLGCRNLESGKEAAHKIQSSTVHPIHTKLEVIYVDLSKYETIIQLKEYLQEHNYKLQVLVNNAATASHGSSLTKEIASNTLQTNYFGTKHMVENLIDLMENNGRIVNVSSLMGQYYTDAKSQYIKQNLSHLKLEDVDKLANDFIDAVAHEQIEQRGWRNNSYAVSKLLLNTFTQIYVRDMLANKAITMNCMCPGYTKTNMSSWKGTKTPAEGATTAVYLATDESVKNETGGFFENCKKTHF